MATFSPKINVVQIELCKLRTLWASASAQLFHRDTLGLLCNSVFFLVKGETTTPRAILTGHDYEVTCAAVCAELGLVLSGSQGNAVVSSVSACPVMCLCGRNRGCLLLCKAVAHCGGHTGLVKSRHN